MKKIILLAFTLALFASGCKTFKSSKKSEAASKQTETTTEPKVFSVPAPKSSAHDNPVYDNTKESTEPAAETTGKPVSMKSEKFNMSSEDQAVYGKNNYFIIAGSFKSSDNASRFKQELAKQGFKPIILHSETGLFRVCVDSFHDESSARSRVQTIRTKYPKYADAWLLIKK